MKLKLTKREQWNKKFVTLKEGVRERGKHRHTDKDRKRASETKRVIQRQTKREKLRLAYRQKEWDIESVALRDGYGERGM